MGDRDIEDRQPGAPSNRALPALTAVAVGPVTSLDPSLYVPQELRHPPRRDAYEVDDAINIIEDGEHVSAEDFGLSSTEISMSAPITMNVGMEIHAIQQIDAFLAARPAPALVASDPSQQLQQAPQTSRSTSATEMTKQEAPCEGRSSTSTASESVTTTVASAESSGPSQLPASASVPAPSTGSYPTRRSDKVLQLESHPLVESVALDGRHVVCKCGKSVRLNPPWYIMKYEQHIVSRNCTFLRKKKTKRDQEAQDKVINNISENSSEAPVSDAHTEESRDDETPRENASSDADASFVRETNTTVRITENDDDQYGLKSADDLLRRYSRPKGDQPADGGDGESERIATTLDTLKTHPHFRRITPDGKFLECKCSELIILGSPWELREFHAHVDSKSKPQAPPRRKTSTSTSTRKPRLGDGAAHRVEQRLIVRETRWKPVSKHTELPCPGLRGERLSAYISSTTKTTGGSRARRRIAEELFPHHFASLNGERKMRAKLSSEEKMTLRDAVESEALWFIDHDANSIRSLDCRGSIAVNKGEDCCAGCSELRSNASLRVSVTIAIGHKRIPDDVTAPADNIAALTKPKSSSAGFALLEQEFDMTEEYARLLRDLFRADVEESSVKNIWFDMANLGITGSFAAHPAFMGLLESMMMRKGKEKRGVGLQNMTYSDHLDSFMKSVSDISPQACDLFQQRLGGRKQKHLLSAKKRRLDGNDAGHSIDGAHGHSNLGPDSQEAVTTGPSTSTEGFSHLRFDLAGSATISHLADMQEVDLSSFQAEQSVLLNEDNGVSEQEETEAFLTDENLDVAQEDVDDGAICKLPSPPPEIPPITPGYMPCRGLRDPKVQAYVVNAVQIIGGSRPRYIVAKELFPEVFGTAKKVKITEMLTDEERGILSDAIFSECLWRVDRISNCVRSLRCFRRVDKKRGNGICRACLELKSIANFRSVLCRAKVPKKVENLKFVPSVYTESDPFMRKLSKNASLRTLYQTVKRTTPEEKKQVTFWLRLAKMGLFGHFRSHTVFEGLIASMVELKDRERRGVGKQNMLYAKSLDEFMAELATISFEAFELFSHHFCGRTTRSQKVKKRKALTQLYNSAIQQARVANSIAMASSSMATVSCVPLDVAVSQPPPVPVAATAPTIAGVGDAHAMMMSDDLLGAARTISTAEMEENQRFMDRMLDEVRLSVTHDDHEEHLDPQTYLDENGVLTTVL